jgi:hypothetical protein
MNTNPFEEEESKSSNLFDNPQGTHSQRTTPKTVASFQGLIGRCFEPYLNIYIDSIDK